MYSVHKTSKCSEGAAWEARSQQESARRWLAIAVMFKIWGEEGTGVWEACGVEISGNEGVGGSGILLTQVLRALCDVARRHTHTPLNSPAHPVARHIGLLLKGLPFHIHEPLYLLSFCLFCLPQSHPSSSLNFCPSGMSSPKATSSLK